MSRLLQTSYQPPSMNAQSDRELIVETSTVVPENRRAVFETSGIAEARNTIRIVPEISGRVIDVHEAFFDGGSFRAGEVLFSIDQRDFQQAVASREADVDKLQAALDLARAEVEAAVGNWRRVNGDKPVPSLVAKEPQLKQAQAQLKAAQAQLSLARLNLQRTQFSLPFDGRVQSSDIAAGQFISAGQAYGEVFDINSLEIRASLEEKQLEWLLEAEAPDITFTGTHLGQPFSYRGALRRSVSSLNPDTRFATVSFGFAEPTRNQLIPGVFANIEIAGQMLKNVLTIPSGAVQSQGVIWKVNNGVLERWQPQPLFSTRDFVVVKGGREPFTIVTSRLSGGSEGMQVKVRNPQATDTDDE